MGFLKLQVRDLQTQRPAAHVRILGVCVAADGSKQQLLTLHVGTPCLPRSLSCVGLTCSAPDDGTGVLRVQAQLDAVGAAGRKELSSGALVRSSLLCPADVVRTHGSLV